MRHVNRSTVLVFALAAGGLGVVTPASAGCTGPSIYAPAAGAPARQGTAPAPPPVARLRAGDPVTIEGIGFFTGCADVFEDDGCGAPRAADPQKPRQDVPLELVQGGTTWPLGTADATGADSYATTWEARVPDQVRPGSAELRAGTATLAVLVAP